MAPQPPEPSADEFDAEVPASIEPAAVTPTPALVERYGDFPAFAATAKVPSVPIYDVPGAKGHKLRDLAHPQESGAPLTFLLKNASGKDWLEVYLPVRPNGSSGWIRTTDVAVSAVTFRVDVHVRAHKLTVYEFGEPVADYPIGVGTANTPTPGGVFYLKELLIPTNKGGFYGPFAYGLSGFSNVLTKFGAGEGVIGIHGTNDEKSVGKDASNGCIRMRNNDITTLAKLLPLGTPVRILV